MSDLVPDLPFSVAITGHRKLSDAHVSALNQSVEGTLSDIAAKVAREASGSSMDAGRKIDLRFLTALAEGADRIAAAAALNLPIKELGWQCKAVLPFARADYAKTFGDDAAAKELDQFLGQMEAVFEIADWYGGKPGADQAVQGGWINRRYSTLGTVLVRNADLLIAAWDGKPAGGPGGTAAVVALALESGTPVVWFDCQTSQTYSLSPDEDQSSRDVLELALAARSAGADGGESAIANAIAPLLLGSAEGSPTRLSKYLEFPLEEKHTYRRAGKTFIGSASSAFSLLQWISLIGKKSEGQKLRPWPFQLARRENGRLSWLPDPMVRKAWHEFDAKLRADEGDPDAARKIAAATSVDEPMRAGAIRADYTATVLGDEYRSSYVLIFILASFAVMFALLFIFAPAWKPAFVAVEVLVLVAAYFLYRRASSKGRDLHQRWMDARNIAENVRGEQMLAWAGISGRQSALTGKVASPDSEDGRSLAAYNNALQAAPKLPDGAMDAGRIATLASAIASHCASQRDYHRLNAHRLEGMHHWLDRIGISAIGLGLAASLLYLVFKFAYFFAPASPQNGFGNALSILGSFQYPMSGIAAFFGGVAPAFAAALTGIRYHGDFERLAHRSQLSEQGFSAIVHRANALQAEANQLDGKGTLAPSRPLYEVLMNLVDDANAIFSEDLNEWRFSVAARPVPPPG